MANYSYIIDIIAKNLMSEISNKSFQIHSEKELIKNKVCNKDFIMIHNINYTLHRKYSANNLQEVYKLYKY